jgi:hypothetical protein
MGVKEGQIASHREKMQILRARNRDSEERLILEVLRVPQKKWNEAHL